MSKRSRSSDKGSSKVGLYETTGDWTSMWWLPKIEVPSVGRQVAVQADAENPLHIPHLFFIPAGEPPKDGWPLIVFLHGQGESSPKPLSGVALQGPPQHAGRHPETLPFAVLSPQKPKSAQFYDDDIASKIIGTMEYQTSKHQLDASRVYLTGCSQGGIGTWGIASDARYGHKFAAAAPICGNLPRPQEERARHLSDMPLWVFHGANDRVMPVSLSDKSTALVSKIKRTAYAGEVVYSQIAKAPDEDYAWKAAGIPPMTGHASWVEAYYPKGSVIGDVPLYGWFMKYRRAL